MIALALPGLAVAGAAVAALLWVAAAVSRSVSALTEASRGNQEILDQLVAQFSVAPTVDLSGVHERLDALDLSRAKWEAEVEAMMTKAESRFSAARAAEERNRRGRRQAEDDDDDAEGELDFDALPAHYQAALQGHARAGDEEGVQPVQMELDADDPSGDAYQWAAAMKWQQ